MAYLRQYQMAGDPFLGGLFKGIGRVAGFIGKATGILPGGGVSKSAVKEAVEAGLGRVLKSPAARAGAIGAGVGAVAGAIGGRVSRAEREAMGMPRRYRRMNPGNVRALRRSMRRVNSFAKLARQTISFTHRVKMKKRGRK